MANETERVALKQGVEPEITLQVEAAVSEKQLTARAALNGIGGDREIPSSRTRFAGVFTRLSATRLGLGYGSGGGTNWGWNPPTEIKTFESSPHPTNRPISPSRGQKREP